MTGGANASYSTEVTERVRAGPVTGSGVRMQFKPTVSKNVNYDNPLEKNVSHIWTTCWVNFSVMLFNDFDVCNSSNFVRYAAAIT